MRIVLARVLVGFACLLFGMALGLPVFSLTPGMGELTGWIRILKPDVMATTYQTLLGGISFFWISGNASFAIFLSLCCVVLPLTKFFVLWGECLGLNLMLTATGRFCITTAKFALVDVLLVALLILVVEGLPGGSVITLYAGFWCFFGAVVLPLFAAQVLKKRKDL